MKSSIPNRREIWSPPPRPDWVARANAEGDGMDIAAIIPLDEDSLLSAAMRKTGLQDFGGEEWVPHFRFIIRALDEEADLNMLGRLTARAHLVNVLEGRLRIEETYRNYPQIEAERIAAPMFIIGQGRSGTSALQNLLAHDPDSGTLLTWEAMYPVPPPETATYRSDPRIAQTDAFITQWIRINPATGSVHEWGGAIPCECVQAFSYAFLSQWFVLLGQITSYVDYMAAADWRHAYAYHRRVLKLLQWRNPRKRWLLKSPTHMPHLPTLLETYPDASLIWPHRDPVKAIASVTSLAGNRNWVTSDRPRVTGYEQYTDPTRAAAMLTQPIEWLQQGIIPPSRLCNVQYHKFMLDPLAVTQDIYRHFSISVTPDAQATMLRYIKESPRDARPAHDYARGSDTQVAEQRALFRRYTNYFQVDLEP